ncbi:ornithine cyclodeaminase family protein [Inquilinus limosus]|uniref:ornithine cyclodeaminase family protein n=1 Tax=Inquilinus limosus TaxID=171674 RepID=UPI003F18A97E
MTRIASRQQIESVMPQIDPIEVVEQAFLAYSRGQVVVPPVGELLFAEPPGEMHVKYGAVAGDDVFAVKIATGFYRNPALGLPPFDGVVLVFSARTGRLEAILLDEGLLTNLRTAAAGAVAARHLAPPHIRCIGICGSGTQARLQAELLRSVTTCRDVLVWARDGEKAARCAEDLAALGFRAERAASVATLAAASDLIVTTTAATEPYLLAGHVRPGTHVTAIGSDTPAKTELAPALLGRADIVVADSLPQTLERGEIHHAVAAGALSPDRVVEIGAIIADPARGRTAPEQITIADLTGVAAQDIFLAKVVCRALRPGPG